VAEGHDKVLEETIHSEKNQRWEGISLKPALMMTGLRDVQLHVMQIDLAGDRRFPAWFLFAPFFIIEAQEAADIGVEYAPRCAGVDDSLKPLRSWRVRVRRARWTGNIAE